MATSNSSNDGRPDSIIVSNLPRELLLADLKTLILEHFANYGKILRLSCASKGGRERTAHIQFSTSDEALNATQNGKVVNGHSMIITITEKRPSTQILIPTPKPVKSTTSTGSTENKSNVQATLASYFQRPTSSISANKERKEDVKRLIPTAGAILEEAVRGSSASDSVPGTSGSETHQVERKHNSCADLTVYQGPSSHSQGVPNTSNSEAVPAADNAPAPVTLRPSRSLSEILNLDISKMKIVKTITASDALACQYFTGAKSHPFPLSMMFGRMPGSVIMPVKSLMDSIKPGMKITDTTVNTVWNTILQSVLKKVLPQTAKAVLHKSIAEKLVLEKYNQLEEEIVNQEVVGTVEKEIGHEEDVEICCEEVMEAMLGLVCTDLIEVACGEEHRPAKAVSKALECCFRKLTGAVVRETVLEVMPNAILDNLCEEALDDILDSPIFGRHVKVVAAEALMSSRTVKLRKELKKRSVTNSSSTDASARKCLNAVSDLVPSTERSLLTKSWLETSSFDLHRDFRATEMEPSIETDISSLESTESSSSTTRPSTSRTLFNNSFSVLNSSNSSGTVVEKPVADPQSGFLVSLKRKANTLLSNINPFKRRRYDM